MFGQVPTSGYSIVARCTWIFVVWAVHVSVRHFIFVIVSLICWCYDGSIPVQILPIMIDKLLYECVEYIVYQQLVLNFNTKDSDRIENWISSNLTVLVLKEEDSWVKCIHLLQTQLTCYHILYHCATTTNRACEYHISWRFYPRLIFLVYL